MNKYPIAWFAVVMIFGFLYIQETSQWFIVFVLAVILAKQIEILKKLDK